MKNILKWIRYYRGTIKIRIDGILGKKALITYLEDGTVGTKDLPKKVHKGDKDITLVRHCWRNNIQ